MKRIALIITLFSTVINLFSQSGNYLTETNKREYFEKNILSLDPIEGIYDVATRQQGSNSFQTFPAKSDNIELTIFKTGNGTFGMIGNNMYSIEKIGDTNAYNFLINWSDIGFVDKKRIILNQASQFQVTFTIPEKQMKYDMGRDYQSGFKVEFNFNCIKKFPTNSMYIDAIKKKSEEQNTVNDWSGTCFAIDKTLCVTNFHVVDGANNLKIQGINGDFSTEYRATLIASDKNNDIAIIKIDDSKFKGFTNIPYKILTNTSEVGEEVFVLGYPLTATMGDEIKLTTGIISSKTGFQGDIALYQISAPIQPGNSGGPLFDNQGNVIGIVSAKHTGTENVGYAIKTTYLKILTESINQQITLPINNQISNLNLINKVKTVKGFVFLLKCNKNTNQNLSYSNSNQSANNYSSTVSNIIHNPKFSSTPSNNKGLTIKKIYKSNGQTYIEFEYDNQNSRAAWVAIDKNTYIENVNTGEKFKMIEAQNMAIDPKKHYFNSIYDKLNFTLTFPALPANTTTINFIETETSSWRFYGISLK